MALGFRIKQGDTLAINGQLTDDEGVAIDITFVSITSQVRDANGTLAGAATVTKPNTTLGQFTLTWQTDSTWPLGQLAGDIAYADSNVTLHSDTFAVFVAAPVTHA